MAKSQAIKPGYLFTPKYTNYVFSLLFLLYMFDYIDRTIVSALLPDIMAEYGLDFEKGAYVYSVVYLSIFALTIPISALVDRWSRRKTIGIMATIWSLATAACAITTNFAGLLVARSFIGTGEAGYSPGGSAMISAMYPKEKRSWIMGLWNASIPLGSAIGVLVGGIIVVHWGWRSAFGIVAIPGLIIALLFFKVKDYKTAILVKKKSVDNSISKARMGVMDMAKYLFGKPALVLTYFGFTAVVFVTTSILAWLPTYFHNMYNIPMDKAGPKASMIMLLALIGAPLGGYLTDQWRKKRINARLLLPGIAILLSCIFSFIAFTIFTDVPQYIFLLLMGMTITAFIPGAAAATQDLVQPGIRATSFAVAVAMQTLLGGFFGPIAIGNIADKTSMETAMKILPLFLLAGALFFFVGAMFYKKDLDKVEDVPLEVAE